MAQRGQGPEVRKDGVLGICLFSRTNWCGELGVSSVAERLPSVGEVLSSSPSTAKNEEIKIIKMKRREARQETNKALNPED